MLKIKEFLLDKLVTSYNESTSFVMTITITLLYIKDKEFRDIFFNLEKVSGKTDFTSFIFGIFLIIGILLTIYNAFSNKKNHWDNEILLTYILLINIFVSLFTFQYLDKLHSNYEVIFPFFNIIYSYTIGILFIKGKIEVKRLFSDKDIQLHEILIDTIIITLIIFYSKNKLNNNWMITFSICISYTITLNSLIIKFNRIILSKIRYLLFK
ncbi:MAG: hypothetical protein CVV49_09505 [Spirochaetae bacterium HGW-Spirochaetae-5]|nr:MAG: hypothetical protein CVV49_09505 [Spirochaetae bacterium HGW-Spirochaetae-5]